MKRRVVVTGIGMVTPLGLDVKTTWDAVLHGKSGVGPITAFDATEFSIKICARVKDFDPAPYLDPKEGRKSDMFMQYAVAAAAQAMTDSGFVTTDANARRAGVAVGA